MITHMELLYGVNLYVQISQDGDGFAFSSDTVVETSVKEPDMKLIAEAISNIAERIAQADPAAIKNPSPMLVGEAGEA
jgi:hypothetical protein